MYVHMYVHTRKGILIYLIIHTCTVHVLMYVCICTVHVYISGHIHMYILYMCGHIYMYNTVYVPHILHTCATLTYIYIHVLH